MAENRSANPAAVRNADGNFSWQGVERLPYKVTGTAPSKSISRQTLFSDPCLQGELRYFEIEPGGYSTLERHAHMHAVMILRGEGRCLIGTSVHAVRPHDLVTIEPWTWHQFRASPAQPLGFLCLVNASRDKPQMPSADDLARLKIDPLIAAFLSGS
ncbi:MAG: cupin domain-containing protein [Beijerinckiaceae bacterium]|nr:cupin domain-containing protein [Beijerinckiaceae bacterium]